MRRRVLIADDGPLDVTVFSVRLREKYDVETATCCDEVRKVLAAQHETGKIDLILMDLRLRVASKDRRDPPIVTGYLLYKELKRARRLVGTHVVFMTNYDLEYDAQKMKKEGLRIFYKETDPLKLLKFVDDSLGKKVAKRRKK